MDFARQHILLSCDGNPQPVTIAADALLFWWGADVGPQDAEGLIAAHWDEIEAAVAMKRARRAFEADGSILLSDEDFE